MTLYRSLNDAAPLCPELAPGPHRILYRRLDGRHVEIGRVAGEDPEALFSALQGENWSPRGEARTLICSLGAQHTSMSVGDRIHFADGRLLEVAVLGFRVLEPPAST